MTNKAKVYCTELTFDIGPTKSSILKISPHNGNGQAFYNSLLHQHNFVGVQEDIDETLTGFQHLDGISLQANDAFVEQNKILTDSDLDLPSVSDLPDISVTSVQASVDHGNR